MQHPTTPGIVGITELRQRTGLWRKSAIERYLTRHGIRFFPGFEGPWTTIDLINAAGGITPAAGANQSGPKPYTTQELFP